MALPHTTLRLCRIAAMMTVLGCGSSTGDGSGATRPETHALPSQDATSTAGAAAPRRPAADGGHGAPPEQRARPPHGKRDAGAPDAGRPDSGRDGGSQAGQPDERGGSARDRLVRGRRVYVRVCARCHPGGSAGRGPRLIGKRLSPARVIDQIRNGRGRMRPIPYSKLPPREIEPLLTFLRSLRTVRGGTGR